MAKILFLFLFILFAACGKSQTPKDCTPTEEYIKSMNYKTSGIVLTDGYQVELNYVKPQEYNKKKFCYGILKTTQDTVKRIVKDLNIPHDANNIYMLRLYGKNNNMCNAEKVFMENITAYCVCYKDKDNYATTDYINLQSGTKETYRVSAYNTSAAIYFLQFRTGITTNPSLIDIQNNDFIKYKDIVKFIDRSDDKLQKIVEKNRIR